MHILKTLNLLENVKKNVSLLWGYIYKQLEEILKHPKVSRVGIVP